MPEGSHGRRGCTAFLGSGVGAAEVVKGSLEVTMVGVSPCTAQTPGSAGGRDLELCPFSLEASCAWLFPRGAGGWLAGVTREVGHLPHWRFLGDRHRRCNKTSAMVRDLELNEQL